MISNSLSTVISLNTVTVRYTPMVTNLLLDGCGGVTIRFCNARRRRRQALDHLRRCHGQSVCLGQGLTGTDCRRSSLNMPALPVLTCDSATTDLLSVIWGLRCQ